MCGLVTHRQDFLENVADATGKQALDSIHVAFIGTKGTKSNRESNTGQGDQRQPRHGAFMSDNTDAQMEYDNFVTAEECLSGLTRHSKN